MFEQSYYMRTGADTVDQFKLITGIPGYILDDENCIKIFL